MKDTTNADLTIKTTGYQWKWGYDYLNGEGEGLAFISTLDSGAARDVRQPASQGARSPTITCSRSTTRMVVPVREEGSHHHHGQRRDPRLHGAAAFGIKQDAIPGFVRDTWFRAETVGDYYGQCQELCGKEHAYMPIHVKVVSAADYTTWVAAKRKEAAAKLDDPTKVWTLPDMMARGEKVYAANCAACHQANGKGAGPIKALDGDPKVLDADHKVQADRCCSTARTTARCRPGSS